MEYIVFLDSQTGMLELTLTSETEPDFGTSDCNDIVRIGESAFRKGNVMAVVPADRFTSRSVLSRIG